MNEIYYGTTCTKRTHRLSQASKAFCKRAKESGEVVWLTEVSKTLQARSFRMLVHITTPSHTTLTHTLTHTLALPLPNALTHTLAHILTHTLAHTLTHTTLTHTLTHTTLTHTLTHSSLVFTAIIFKFELVGTRVENEIRIRNPEFLISPRKIF